MENPETTPQTEAAPQENKTLKWHDVFYEHKGQKVKAKSIINGLIMLTEGLFQEDPGATSKEALESMLKAIVSYAESVLSMRQHIRASNGLKGLTEKNGLDGMTAMEDWERATMFLAYASGGIKNGTNVGHVLSCITGWSRKRTDLALQEVMRKSMMHRIIVPGKA